MLTGSFVALVTPMLEDLSVDWVRLDALVEWHIEQGTHAIVVMGTTGESATLPMGEHLSVIQRVVDGVAGQIPVIAGTGANSIHEALELTAGAKSAKADACLLVTPYYNKPTQDGLYHFHKYIAEHVAIPQILYNVPGRTAVDLLPETIARLASIDNIVGVKEATGDLSRVEQIRSTTPDRFALYSGDDETALEFMRLGGHGDISVTANVAPAKVAQMCELTLAGKVDQASLIDEGLRDLHRTLFLESNPIPVKWALAEMGLIEPYLRLPLTALSSTYHEPLRAALRAAGCLPDDRSL